MCYYSQFLSSQVSNYVWKMSLNFGSFWGLLRQPPPSRMRKPTHINPVKVFEETMVAPLDEMFPMLLIIVWSAKSLIGQPVDKEIKFWQYFLKMIWDLEKGKNDKYTINFFIINNINYLVYISYTQLSRWWMNLFFQLANW